MGYIPDETVYYSVGLWTCQTALFWTLIVLMSRGYYNESVPVVRERLALDHGRF